MARSVVGIWLAGMVSACSTIKLGYNNLDELVYWWIDDYIDISSVQSVSVRDAIDTLHDWHRAHELVPLASALDALGGSGGQQLDADAVCALIARGNASLHATARRGVPALASLVTTLDAEQFATLALRLADKRREWHDEWALADDAQASKRQARFADLAERFYGTLNAAQQAQLHAHVAQTPFDLDRIEAEMARRADDTLTTLRAATIAGQSEREALLRDWLHRLQTSPDAAYQRYNRQITRASCDTWSRLHAAATPAQRQRAMARAADLANDLRALAAQ